MREIKFRQAIYKNGKFHHWHYWGYVGHRGEFLGPLTITGIRNEYEIKESESYTGDKDKNGKEIYEGDILRFIDYNKGWNPTLKKEIWDAIGVIEWQQGNCQPLSWSAGQEVNFEKWVCAYPYEIIGNVFENKELLK